jgi:hypothetical protein
MIRHMLYPGKIENWVVIVNMKQQWVNVKLEAIQQFIQTMSNNYPCRLYRIYLFRAPSSIQKLQRIIYPLIPEVARDKIVIEKYFKLPKELMSHTLSTQLERNLGGIALNKLVFWPPTIPTRGLEATSLDLYSI